MRCRDLDRYVKRLARHLTIRKDPDFRVFLQVSTIKVTIAITMTTAIILDISMALLQEVKLSASLVVKRSVGQRVGGAVTAVQDKTYR